MAERSYEELGKLLSTISTFLLPGGDRSFVTITEDDLKSTGKKKPINYSVYVEIYHAFKDGKEVDMNLEAFRGWCKRIIKKAVEGKKPRSVPNGDRLWNEFTCMIQDHHRQALMRFQTMSKTDIAEKRCKEAGSYPAPSTTPSSTTTVEKKDAIGSGIVVPEAAASSTTSPSSATTVEQKAALVPVAAASLPGSSSDGGNGAITAVTVAPASPADVVPKAVPLLAQVTPPTTISSTTTVEKNDAIGSGIVVPGAAASSTTSPSSATTVEQKAALVPVAAASLPGSSSDGGNGAITAVTVAPASPADVVPKAVPLLAQVTPPTTISSTTTVEKNDAIGSGIVVPGAAASSTTSPSSATTVEQKAALVPVAAASLLGSSSVGGNGAITAVTVAPASPAYVVPKAVSLLAQATPSTTFSSMTTVEKKGALVPVAAKSHTPLLFNRNVSVGAFIASLLDDAERKGKDVEKMAKAIINFAIDYES